MKRYQLLLLLSVLAFASGCTAMLVGGDVNNRPAVDCDDSQQAEACKK